jgi:hypothetical protein
MRIIGLGALCLSQTTPVALHETQHRGGCRPVAWTEAAKIGPLGALRVRAETV